ncbi:MAG: UDP-N-acetylmuramoyl-L-alanyl-D-glutamate--2,6-diaminopimelate ligase [Syntrophales bacterium]|nr:UDP-N-acetylmuramoyl-L-alanyl-D-glutamate--2,6-diaminopimelate ligase [Syntrophales bacterium]
MRLRDVIRDTEVISVKGDLEVEVTSLCYDSRQCEENSLFVAIPGFKTDGHAYVQEAISRGARVIVHEKDLIFPSNVTGVKVRDARDALGKFSRNFYRNPSRSLCLIGVVGTNGKTTITYLLESIFRKAGVNCGVLGTINYRFEGREIPASNTTPESCDFQRMLYDMKESGVKVVVAEVSSHALALKRVDDCEFDVGIFTNLSRDHLDFHGNMENYFNAKRRFFSEILACSPKKRERGMIVNVDDMWGKRLLRDVPLKACTYGVESAANIRPLHYECTLEGIFAEVAAGGVVLTLNSPLIGKFNLSNILAVVACGLVLGVGAKDIIDGVASLKCVPGRLEKISRDGQPCVFVDYAHTEDALSKVLGNLREFKTSRVITVFGCGGDRDRGKRPLMGRAALEGSDWIVITSDNPRSEDPLSIIAEIESGIKDLARNVSPERSFDHQGKIYSVIPDRREAIELAISQARPGDIVLVAGKGHEDYQIIGDRKIFFDDRVVAREALERYHS